MQGAHHCLQPCLCFVQRGKARWYSASKSQLTCWGELHVANNRGLTPPFSHTLLWNAAQQADLSYLDCSLPAASKACNGTALPEFASSFPCMDGCYQQVFSQGWYCAVELLVGARGCALSVDSQVSMQDAFPIC